jgi:hypothetical protein
MIDVTIILTLRRNRLYERIRVRTNDRPLEGREASISYSLRGVPPIATLKILKMVFSVSQN